MNLAEFLYEYGYPCGLKACNIPIEKGMEICNELEENYPSPSIYGYCLEVYSDGSYNIVEKNFWKKDEHPHDERDRILMCVENHG